MRTGWRWLPDGISSGLRKFIIATGCRPVTLGEFRAATSSPRTRDYPAQNERPPARNSILRHRDHDSRGKRTSSYDSRVTTDGYFGRGAFSTKNQDANQFSINYLFCKLAFLQNWANRNHCAQHEFGLDLEKRQKTSTKSIVLQNGLGQIPKVFTKVKKKPNPPAPPLQRCAGRNSLVATISEGGVRGGRRFSDIQKMQSQNK